MKKYLLFLAALTYSFAAASREINTPPVKFFKANNPDIRYVGRVLFDDPFKPRFWSPGVYIQARFKGTSLEMLLNDEELYGNSHNYIEVVIDNQRPIRLQTTRKVNDLKVADKLPPGEHTVTICKDTESGIGYIDFIGLKCEKLLPVKLPKRKMEYIGDSITCGSGIDESAVKCDQGKWYDQHNAYMSYGPVTSRALNAQWVLSSVSGIGLIHSCCDMKIVMPQVYDKVNMRNDSIQWNFKGYTPDVVTICLGQNDGKQDSVAFCSAYVKLIDSIRSVYPKADIVCLSSPMANAELTAMLRKYLTGIQQYVNTHGNKNVYHYFFSRSFNSGCVGHPNMAQHQLIAAELTSYLKKLESW